MLAKQPYHQTGSKVNFSRLFMNLVLFMTISFLIVIFTLNALFSEPLFMLGVNFIYILQVGFQSKVFAVLMNIFSIICNTPIISLIFLLEMGLVKHKLKAIIHLSFFLIGFQIIAILKQSYQQSRPIWVSSEISRWEWFCPTDFGNPSGHSYVAFPLFQPLVSKFIGFEKLKIAWGFVILFGVVVPFSRLYLGVHSVNQILFGFCFGMAWIVIFRYGMRELFYKVFAWMLKLKRINHLIGVIFVHMMLTIIPIVVYKIRSENTGLSQRDLNNLNRICGSSVTSASMQSSMFNLCILHSIAFGFMYGLFALKNRENTKLYFLGLWSYRDKLSILLHCLCQFLCIGVIPLVVLVGFRSFWREEYSKFLVFNASLASGGFLLIWLTEKFERKYGWIEYENEQITTLQAGIDIKTGENLSGQLKQNDQMRIQDQSQNTNNLITKAFY